MRGTADVASGLALRIGAFALSIALCAGVETVGATAVAATQEADPEPGLSMSVVGSFRAGRFDEGAAEIVAFDARTRRAFVVNGAERAIDVLDLSDPARPERIGRIDVKPHGGRANSVDARDGVVVAAIEAERRTDPGRAVFFDAATLEELAQAAVGAQPDMVTFTPDGRRAVTADEGEPDDAGTIDPEGSITILDLERTAGGLHVTSARAAGFRGFESGELRAQGVRVSRPGATAAQDLEPEYVAVSPDSRTAWVTLQENNSLAQVDLEAARVTRIVALGFKDHSRPGNALDASDRDGGPRLREWPLLGMYQPDAIAAFAAGGATWLVAANEGDARAYAGFNEELRVAEAPLDAVDFPAGDESRDPATLALDSNLGRLKVSRPSCDPDGDGDLDRLVSFGGRSISILDGQGALVWESGDLLERTVAARAPDAFNDDNSENAADGRSDDKGPEPEGVEIGTIDGRTYAFVGLERQSAIVVFDVTDPRAPVLVEYASRRDFSIAPGPKADAGDLGPEGLCFVPAADSPIGAPLLLVGNEVSGTTTVWRVDANE